MSSWFAGKKGEKGDGFGKSSGKGFDKGYGKDGKGKGKVIGKGFDKGYGKDGKGKGKARKTEETICGTCWEQARRSTCRNSMEHSTLTSPS